MPVLVHEHIDIVIFAKRAAQNIGAMHHKFVYCLEYIHICISYLTIVYNMKHVNLVRQNAIYLHVECQNMSIFKLDTKKCPSPFPKIYMHLENIHIHLPIKVQ